MFKKRVSLAGLDIGSRTIKAGEIVETSRGRMLNSFGAVDVPDGLVEEEIIRDPAAVADLVRQLFRMSGIRERNVAIAVGGSRVITKHNVNIDSGGDLQLDDTIRYEAEQYIPFDINDIHLGFHIVGESFAAPGKMEVILVAAKKELIESCEELVRMAGLTPMVIDVDAFALQNIYEINYDSQDESIALIDIGARKTSLSIVKDGKSVFTRDALLGCAQITQSIMSFLDCSFEEAEEIKQSGQAESISTADLREITSTVVAEWCQEISRDFDFYATNNPEDSIKRVVLSGGGAHVTELHNLLSQEVNADVETINPFERLDINSERVDISLLEEMGPQAAICLGLALRRIDDDLD